MAVREPRDPKSLPPPLDRRVRRLGVPRCPVCKSAKTAVATRTEFFVYFRCADCAFVWSAPKPGREANGS
jgi:hypothetical protein